MISKLRNEVKKGDETLAALIELKTIVSQPLGATVESSGKVKNFREISYGAVK
jgi:hypothetical protein